jgi:hypothetical protein
VIDGVEALSGEEVRAMDVLRGDGATGSVLGQCRSLITDYEISHQVYVLAHLSANGMGKVYLSLLSR